MTNRFQESGRISCLIGGGPVIKLEVAGSMGRLSLEREASAVFAEADAVFARSQEAFKRGDVAEFLCAANEHLALAARHTLLLREIEGCTQH